MILTVRMLFVHALVVHCMHTITQAFLQCLFCLVQAQHGFLINFPKDPTVNADSWPTDHGHKFSSHEVDVAAIDVGSSTASSNLLQAQIIEFWEPPAQPTLRPAEQSSEESPSQTP